jgi:hypothetical protein
MTLQSARFALPLLAAGQAQKELTHNEALALIDAGLCPAVETVGDNAPPPSPLAGQCWIVGPTPTGVWAGHGAALACWTESGWRFLPAAEGLRAWVKGQRLWAVKEVAGWVIGDDRVARVLVDGRPVLGARGAAVPAPSGGATVDVEARAAITSIIDRLAAHGLIED